MSRRLIPITDADALMSAGLPFPTTHSARWCFRHAAERGVADAFVRLGKRIFIDPDRFHALVRREASAA